MAPYVSQAAVKNCDLLVLSHITEENLAETFISFKVSFPLQRCADTKVGPDRMTLSINN